MSGKINLLPHREERRKRARVHFAVLGGMTALLGIVIVGAVWLVYSQRISAQEDRNKFLKGEIAKLDKEIDEIKDVKDKIAALLARKQVIETLQTDRVQTVYLLDELVRQMPEGVFLKSVKQRGSGVELVGYAQSNARVSTLMRNIESSPWLANPNLVEIKATNLGKMRISEFNLKLQVKRPTAAAAGDGAKDGAKDAAKPAAKG
ncbi:MAG TPA: PilN domain-containing protein [Burkholderiales bacterium]|nr:PilN domain-containing protein [Burkholderiales bacterium]